MCRPGHGFSRNLLTGGHIGPPLRGVGRCSGTNGNWRRTEAFPNGAGRSPPPTREPEQGGASKTAGCAWGVASASQIPKRNLGRQSWSPRLTEATQVVPSEGPMWASAPTKGEQAASTTRASGAQRSGRERWVEIAAEITPKGASNAGQSLSQPAADSSLYTREPLETGDTDRRVGPAGLLAMTTVSCHSEERSDVGIRPFYDGRGFGPPSHRPLRKARSTTRASRRAAKRPRPRGMGGNHRKDHPKRGPPPRLPR